MEIIYSRLSYKSFTPKSRFPKSAYLDPEQDEHIASTETWNSLQYFDFKNEPNRPDRLSIPIVLKIPKKSLKRRNKKLDKQKHHSNEHLKSIWYNDPARAGLECFDHGEIEERHKEFRNTAVRRYFYREGGAKKSVLLRLVTASPVVWNNEKQEWMDIQVVDEHLKKKFKSLVRFGDGFGKYLNPSSADNDIDWKVYPK